MQPKDFLNHLPQGDLVDTANMSGTPSARSAQEEAQELSPLYLAAFMHDLDSVKQMLEDGVNINTRNVADADGLHAGSTALCGAAYSQSLPVLTYLLKHHADPDLCGVAGATPLMVAALYGNTDMVRVLLSYGASPELTDQEGSNALHAAARENKADAIRLLLACPGANIMRKQRNALNATPLLEAVAAGSIDAMALLAPKKNDLRGRYENGDTLLHAAACSGQLESVRWLLDRGMNPNTPNKLNIYPLHHAANDGSKHIVDALLEAGANPNALNADNVSPLHLVAANGHVGALRCLIEAGGDIEATDTSVGTPLHFAATSGQEAAARELIRAGANINARGQRNFTPLHCAVCNPRALPCVRMLIQAGAELNATTPQNITPCTIAAAYGATPALILLIRAKADLTGYAYGKVSALEIAEVCGHKDTANLIRKEYKRLRFSPDFSGITNDQLQQLIDNP